MSPLLRIAALSAAIVSTLNVSSVNAAEASANFDVSITVVNACGILAKNMPFSSTSFTLDREASTTVEVSCTGAAPVSIAFSSGGSGDMTNRQMNNGAGATVDYNLYLDGAHSQILGDGTSGTATINFISTGNNVIDTRTIYGLVPAGQVGKPIGTYSDTITATLTY